jgi:hypothetical protein
MEFWLRWMPTLSNSAADDAAPYLCEEAVNREPCETREKSSATSIGMLSRRNAFCFSYIFMQASRAREGWLRLGIGVGLNVALLLFSVPAARWGSYDREAHYDLILLALAASALVTVIPLCWRGALWQAAAAIPLLLLPLICLWVVVDTILAH